MAGEGPDLERFREQLEAWGTTASGDDGPGGADGRLAAALIDVGCLCCAPPPDHPRGGAFVRVRGVLDDPATWADTFHAEAARLECEPATQRARPSVRWAEFRDAGFSVPLMAAMYLGPGGSHRLLVLIATRVL